MSVRVGPMHRTVKSLFKACVFFLSLCSFATILYSEDNQFFFWLQTYIDCLHIRKTDKSRMQAADLMDTENGSSRNQEDNPADHEDKVLWFLFSLEILIACIFYFTHLFFFMELQVEKLRELSKHSDIYEKLTRSLAPNIWELEDVKKGLLCQVFYLSDFGSDCCWMLLTQIILHN